MSCDITFYDIHHKCYQATQNNTLHCYSNNAIDFWFVTENERLASGWKSSICLTYPLPVPSALHRLSHSLYLGSCQWPQKYSMHIRLPQIVSVSRWHQLTVMWWYLSTLVVAAGVKNSRVLYCHERCLTVRHYFNNELRVRAGCNQLNMPNKNMEIIAIFVRS